MKTIKSAVVAFSLLLLSLPAPAMPILYSGTGNYYEMILDDGVSWANAYNDAGLGTFMGVLGHLATILDAGEDLFINQLVENTAGVSSTGFSNSEAWVNGEGAIPAVNAGPGYANWLASEPNNLGGAENWLAVHLNGNFGWNDEGNLGGIAGYVVEYDSRTISLREPGTVLLLAIGLALVVILRRRKSA